jgi:hypothetical protein
MADIVLLDEKAARRIAAILGEAATWGLVEVASAIDRLPDDELQGVPGAAEGDSRPLRHSLRPLKIALARRPVITQHMC